MRLAIACVTVVLGFTIPLRAQDIPADPSTIRTELDQSNGDDGDQLIYVTNGSSHVIIVTSVRLLECENVQGNCSARRLKMRVPPGARVMVHRVRRRFPDQGFRFRYTFTYQEEAAEGVTAKDVAADANALEVDTVIVLPKLVDLKVGETIDLTQLLAIKALNSKGIEIPRVYFLPQVIIGEDFITLEGVKLTGKAVGTAGLSIAASTKAGPSMSSKGAARIVVQVTQ